MKARYLAASVAAIAAGLFAANAMACYTVFDKAGRVAYQGMEPPVDMSMQLRDALQARFPGGHMMFEQTARCTPVSFAQVGRAPGFAAPANTAVMGAGPNRKVAVASRAPMAPSYANNTAVMGAGAAPNTAVMGAGPAMPQEPRTRVASAPVSRGSSPLLTDLQTAQALGLPHTIVGDNIVVVPAAAASRVAMSSMTVVPSAPVVAQARRSGDTVITELRNPPVTVVERGGDMIVSQRY